MHEPSALTISVEMTQGGHPHLRVVKREIKVAAEPGLLPASSSAALRLRRGVSCLVQRSCFRFEHAFRGAGTAADPNDWSEQEQAQQTNAGLEHLGRLPFQIAARQEMLLQSADRHRAAAQCRPRRANSCGLDRLRRNHGYCREA